MPTPWTDFSRVMWKALADGEWHQFHDVIQLMADAVPPGMALRHYEHRLAYRRLHAKTSKVEDTLNDQDKIAYGARGKADRTIQGQKLSGNIQVEGKGREKRIRRTPGRVVWGIDDLDPSAPTAGMVVPSEDGEEGQDEPVQSHDDVPFVAIADTPLPAPVNTECDHVEVCSTCGQLVGDSEKHSQWHAKQQPEMGLFNESELRHLVNKEVGQVLDKFQYNLQRFMDMHFEAVHQQIVLSRAHKLL